MKELTIEQKAKRYDEVINRMKRYVVDEYGCSRIKVADVFPELKESEDERVRKGLMTAVSGTFDGNTLWHTDVTKEEALDWLEKIGEHIRFWLCKAVQARDRVAKPRKGFTSIPFGTDSEFIKEAIAIPDGCVATIEGNKIHIKKK